MHARRDSAGTIVNLAVSKYLIPVEGPENTGGRGGAGGTRHTHLSAALQDVGAAGVASWGRVTRIVLL